MKLLLTGAPRVLKLLVFVLGVGVMMSYADLPTKKYLNLAAIKVMVAGAEAEAQRLHVDVTICVVDESGNLLFLQKADSAPLNTITWAQKKARHAAFYRSPSKDAAENLKKGNVEALAYPDYFPNQGGLPIQVDGQTLGGIAASGAKAEVDEAVAQAGLDAFFGKK
jgi:glc operon protein GlcG